MSYLKVVIQEYWEQPVQQEYSDALKTTAVAKDGQLQGIHTWLEDPLDIWRRSTAKLEVSLGKKKILMLGSAGPAVRELLCQRSDVELVVGE